MQMIEAVIRPNRLEIVKNALGKVGAGVTAFECKGFGRQLGHTERYRGSKMDVGFVPKVLLRICVADGDKDKVIHAIVESAHSGEVGDGKIFIYPVAEVIRIRTGERGDGAPLMRNPMDAAKQPKVPPVINPSADVGELLRWIVSDTGIVQEVMGGFRIKIFHTGGFPWDDVFKTLLYRDFKVYLTRNKADLLIEATP